MANLESVQELLETEQEARQIVEQARQAKSQTMKAARREAEEEIRKFRAYRESEYEKLLSLDAESNKSDGVRLKQKTDVSLAEIEQQLQRNRDSVNQMLLDAVTTV
eukprot:CAMPEP_0201521300 /NCGR_PEP_ID=MMETSP0161_2-20130828/14338_1 /ASSEMBLY_ACC=CAM_ASM_000251 /TAXON_ID=180227 /ORGANISM="Neoparamoeba aestuarina, Strain SoJaBio B1-5/56/2" /LENGTH=105 /DNA_ID=CAMNT_0047919915 /DNA_START=81 /DNA_END=398 /DNA_ORIENTATION=+